MANVMPRTRIALVSTAARNTPGSMRAYAETLMAALDSHVPEVEAELVELSPIESAMGWPARRQTLNLPLMAWRQRRLAPDVWHVLDGSRAYVAAGLRAAPVLVTVHDIIPWLQARGRFDCAPAQGLAARMLWRANGRSLRRAAGLVCVSECSARDVQREFNIPVESTDVVKSPLRPALALMLAQTPVCPREEGLVLHVGNNGFYKNRRQVLTLFSRLSPALARRLVMAGPPPTPELRMLAEGLGLGPRVEWLGDPRDDQLAEYYRQASVLVFPSLYEGYGWPVLEAMAFGLPVVVSDAGSLPEVVGEAGACLPLADEAGFVAALELILSSPEHAARASARGLERAAQFSEKAFARQMYAVYSALSRPVRSAGAR